MNLSVRLLALFSFFFIACEQNLEYNPALPLKGNYIIYEEYLSSSKIKEILVESEKEKTGTAFEIHTNVSVTPNDSGTTILWEPKVFHSNGWNKTLMASIHQKRVDLNIELDKNGDLQKISGFHELPALLKKIDQKPEFTKRLLSRMDTTYYKNLWWDRWILSTLLKKGTYQPNQKLPVEEINGKLKTLKADSVVIRGERNPRNHPCIEYAVHYSKTDSLNIELEEFVEVHKKNLLKSKGTAHITNLEVRAHNFLENHKTYGKIARKGLMDSLDVEGTWRFSISLSTGMPCYEFKKEESPVVLVDSISNKINVTFYRTNENGFKAF